MQEISNTKSRQYPSNLAENKKNFSSNFERSFEENLEDNMKENLEEKHEDISHNQGLSRMQTLKALEKKSLEIAALKKYRDKQCEKVERYLTKKLLEERRRVKVMIQVLNDISKKFPFLLFHVNIDKKKRFF